MIEIVPPNQKKEEQKVTKRKKGTKSSGAHSTFRTAFEQSLDFTLPQDFDELYDELKDQEKKFLEDPSLYNMQRYKALVGKILKILVSDEYVVKVLERKRRDRADFVIIHTIQNKLEEMTKAIITKNKAFDILKTFDEIRGLILDLTH